MRTIDMDDVVLYWVITAMVMLCMGFWIGWDNGIQEGFRIVIEEERKYENRITLRAAGKYNGQYPKRDWRNEGAGE